MFITPEDVVRDTARLSGYAADLSLAVAMANYGGPTGGLLSGGESMICLQRGEILVRLESKGSGVAVALEHSIFRPNAAGFPGWPLDRTPGWQVSARILTRITPSQIGRSQVM